MVDYLQRRYEQVSPTPVEHVSTSGAAKKLRRTNRRLSCKSIEKREAVLRLMQWWTILNLGSACAKTFI